MPKKRAARKTAAKPSKKQQAPAVADSNSTGVKSADGGETRPEWWAKTILDVAAFFGVSYPHVRASRWFVDYEKQADGYYLPELVARRHAQVMRAPQAQSQDDEGESTTTKYRLEAAALSQTVRSRKRVNDEAEGRLLDRDDVNRWLTSRAVRLRTPLFSLATSIAALVPGSQKATAKRMVEETVRNVLSSVRDMQLTDASVQDLILREAEEIRAARCEYIDGGGI